MHAMYTTLIQVSELAALMSNASLSGKLVVLDCRHELSRPEWSDRAFAEEHLPTALQAHIDRDLSGPITAQSGRHPLPDVTKFAQRLGSWGIDNTTQIVAYDQGNGVYAARAWWLLRWVGHQAVAVLDGGFAAWQEAGLPISREISATTPCEFVPHLSTGDALSTAEVQQALARREVALIDARGADRFAGENETIDPVAGHVPGASNRPFAKNVDARGRFLPAAELRRQWTAALGGREAKEVVAMCGSGVSACHNLLALEIAGLPGARLYPGSWSEWIRDPNRPVARGPS
jgi:thiosulfate/3-mercaptopyruvate sulfurtransferase